MEPDLRFALLLIGLVFCAGFGAMTAVVASQDGFSVLTVAAILILALVVPPLVGALFRGPDD